MNPENSFDEGDPLGDTDKIMPIESMAHKAALRRAEQAEETFLLGKNTAAYEFGDSDLGALRKLVSEAFYRALSYDEATALLQEIAKYCKKKVSFENDKDDDKETIDIVKSRYANAKFRLNCTPDELVAATGIICTNKTEGERKSFLSWGLWRPTQDNPFKSGKLFVQVGLP